MKNKILFYFSFSILLFFVACQSNTAEKTTHEDVVLDEATKKEYIQKGKAIAQKTFGTLAGQLKKSLGEGGVPNAIQYCNVAAFPLVDSLSKVHQAKIRRTSLKVRNPKDAPTQLEKVVLDKYATQATAGEKLKPVIEQIDNNTIAFYAPIKINAFCLQCHGEIGESLVAENNQFIQKHYPNDKATGYKDGDLRGIWSIEFTTE